MSGNEAKGPNVKVVAFDDYEDTKEEDTAPKWKFWHKWCRHGCPFWCKKYFWEGQLIKGSADADGFEENIVSPSPFSGMGPKTRKLMGFLLPALVFHFGYWSLMLYRGLLYVYVDKYPMTITMIFGSLMAGMTSVAGGAIAFPVMTLVMKEPPAIARDLSMSLQSCGMSAAAFAIFFMGVHIEMNAFLISLVGSSLGVVIGLEFVDPLLSPAAKKMGFVSIWFSFSVALYLLNRDHKRMTFNNIPNLNWWKRFVLFLSGIVGGLTTSFAGSGADICSFSILTTLFHVSEKVATPTSVVLMAMTSIVGWFWRALVTSSMPLTSWEYLLVVIPIVTVGAPFGSFIGTHFHRLVLAACVYIITFVSLIGAFVIVPQTPALAGGSCAIIVGGCIFFVVLTKIGERLVKDYIKQCMKRRKSRAYVQHYLSAEEKAQLEKELHYDEAFVGDDDDSDKRSTEEKDASKMANGKGVQFVDPKKNQQIVQNGANKDSGHANPGYHKDDVTYM